MPGWLHASKNNLAHCTLCSAFEASLPRAARVFPVTPVMSSNPLKLKIKFSKGSTSKTDPKSDEGRDRPSKKRKTQVEHPPDIQSLKKPVGDPLGRQSRAERDIFGETKRANTQSELAERPKEGNEGSEPKLEPQAKPRLVIK